MPLSVENVKTDTVTADQCAEILGCSRGTIYNGIQRKQIPAIEIGSLKRIPTRWLREKIGAPSQAA